MKKLDILSTTVENNYTFTAVSSTVTAAVYAVDGEECTVSAAEGKVLVLIVDGAQANLVPGASYQVEEAFSIVETGVYKVGGPAAPPWVPVPEDQKASYYFRQALLVNEGKIDDNYSVKPLISGGRFDECGADGITFTSKAPHFNGITVDNGSAYTISNARFYAYGDGGSDLDGWGTVLMADNGAKLELSNTYIETEGGIRCGLYVNNGAVTKATNTVFYSKETTDTYDEYEALVPALMKRVPFALGMEGSVRTLNVMGDGQGIFKDTIVVSTGWGALSCDSGTAYDLCHTYCLDCDNVLSGIGTLEVAQEGKTYTTVKEINGVNYGFTVGGSGYVTYADSGVHNRYKNVQFYSPDYIQIMGSGRSGSAYIDSYLYAEHNTFMTQQSSGGTYELTGTTVDTVDALLQIKSGAANTGFSNIIVDNCKINFSGTSTRTDKGILVELVESDDAGNPAVTEYTINDRPLEAEPTLSAITDCDAVFKNGSYQGDIFNCIYNYHQELNVTLEQASLSGTVSSSTAVHVDLAGEIVPNGTVLRAFTGSREFDHVNYRAAQGGCNGDCLIIGRFKHSPAPMLNNPINLTMTGSTWEVTGNGYLKALTTDSLEAITAQRPLTLTVQKLTVAGEEYADGTYTVGNVTFIVDSTEIEIADNGICDAGQTYSGAAYAFYGKHEDDSLDSKVLTVKRQNYIDGNLYFTLIPTGDYTIASITPDKGTLAKNTAGGELAAYDYVMTPDMGTTEMSVTVVVKSFSSLPETR